MSDSAVDRLMRERPRPPAQAASQEGKFFQVLPADGLTENFIEFRFRNGMRTCFNFGDLQWFSWDPESGHLDMEFGGYSVIIKGRGLYDSLFQGIKNRRVAWVEEASSEMQDHAGNEAFVEEISIIPPSDFLPAEGEGEK